MSDKAPDSIFVFGITLLLITFFDQKIIFLLNNISLRLFSPELLKGYNALQIYNQKLNTLVERKAIQEHFIYFFQKHVRHLPWLIYWLNEDFFELAGANLIKENVPEALDIPDKNAFIQYVSGKNVWDFEHLHHLDKSIDAILFQLQIVDKNILLIPIKSSVNFSGILVIDKEFRKYLQFDQFHDIFFRIIRKTADVLEKADLYYETYLQKVQSEQLLEVSKILTSTLNLDEVLSRIMEVIRNTIPYDAGAIFLVNREKNLLEYKYSVGYDLDAIQRIKLKINQGIVGKVIETGKPSLISDVSKSREYFPLRKSTRSQLTLPIFAGEKTIGAIALESDYINHFRQSDVYFLQGLVTHAAIAISNAWLYQDVLKKRELENDLLNAANVQKTLLIQRVPNIRNLELSISNIPSKIVGGDFYDIIRTRDEGAYISIGDVAGKGASGAILMAVCLAGLRTYTKEIYDVCEITSKLNNLLYETTTSNRYATFFICKIDIQNEKLIYTNAGHNPPILLKNDGELLHLDKGGIVIGFRNTISYTQSTIDFKKDDILVLYTDGIIEAKNQTGEEYGLQRLTHVVKQFKNHKAAEIKQVIFENLKEFTGSSEFEDDITLIVLKHK